MFYYVMFAALENSQISVCKMDEQFICQNVFAICTKFMIASSLLSVKTVLCRR